MESEACNQFEDDPDITGYCLDCGLSVSAHIVKDDPVKAAFLDVAMSRGWIADEVRLESFRAGHAAGRTIHAKECERQYRQGQRHAAKVIRPLLDEIEGDSGDILVAPDWFRSLDAALADLEGK